MNTAAQEVSSPSAAVHPPRDFRLIPRIEKFSPILSFAQTTVGKLILLAVFWLECCYFSKAYEVNLQLTALFGLMTFLPQHRRLILAVSPTVYILQRLLLFIFRTYETACR
jgi:hypothetical protein